VGRGSLTIAAAYAKARGQKKSQDHEDLAPVRTEDLAHARTRGEDPIANATKSADYFLPFFAAFLAGFFAAFFAAFLVAMT
jgi:hypothetical protein